MHGYPTIVTDQVGRTYWGGRLGSKAPRCGHDYMNFGLKYDVSTG
ncbi:hypothetical protein BDK88_2030 [Natrinema hispanicum]|uniref:Uncharacterized protein n=1 Tax=Natrinema hispanicum TaxID=392421 RepID=A0A482YAV4_9EURY|nr:hypothetical protein BDK88_2030 [Natrinema hispanicum]